MLPYRRSIWLPEPPTTGVVWQLPQAFSLNTGPRPSTRPPWAAKLALASANLSGSVPGSGSPIAVTPCWASATWTSLPSDVAHPAIAASAREPVAIDFKYRCIKGLLAGLRVGQHEL